MACTSTAGAVATSTGPYSSTAPATHQHAEGEPVAVLQSGRRRHHELHQQEPGAAQEQERSP
jgi:hypothetical protein